MGQLSAAYSRGRATHASYSCGFVHRTIYFGVGGFGQRTMGKADRMKAVSFDRFGGPEVLQYVEVSDPEPGPGQLLVETTAIGVNFPDVRERLGVYNQSETRVGGVQLPQVTGIALAGTVVATGPATTAGLVGRRVVALTKKGAYAQLAVVEEALSAVL